MWGRFALEKQLEGDRRAAEPIVGLVDDARSALTQPHTLFSVAFDAMTMTWAH